MRGKNKRRGVSSSPTFIPASEKYQVQVINPLADELHVFDVSECDALAVHEAGGPVTAVAVTVTFCEGEKPCAEPLPEK